MNSYTLVELGNNLSNNLREMKLKNESELIIKISLEELKKLDEDFYYRQFPDGKDYVPSEDEIIVKFDNLTIRVTS